MSAFVPSSFASRFSRQGIKVSTIRVCTTPTFRNLTFACSKRSALDAETPQNDDDNGEFTNRSGFTEATVSPEATGDELTVSAEIDTDPDVSEGWYQISQPIGKIDTEGLQQPAGSSDGVFDLMELDGMGRQMLSKSSYGSIVDVDIEEGGVLDDDEDNNELFCGVGLDALIESEQLIENLRDDFKIETATHVQLSAIPRVLDGRDIVVQSHTGTGKTLAFLLPLLDEIDTTLDNVQGVIVAPTRELAMQISRECDRLVANTEIRSLALIGGANPARQVEKLRRRLPHVVIGTPGRVAELEDNRELRLHRLRMLVVDEVDQCLQDAFLEDVVYLLRAARRKTQKVLVSATGDVDSVRQFAGKYLHKAVLLRVGGTQRLPKNITHWYCAVPARLRIEMLRKLMYTKPVPTRAIAFVDDPRRVDIVVERLFKMGVQAAALRGNAHKLERAEVLSAFRKGRVSLLVTTEVAARGLDVREISHVFNVDLPTDADHYVHRAGRCGRVRAAGTVVSIASGETAFVMERLERELGVEIRRMEPRGGEYGQPIDRSGQRDRRTDVRKKTEKSEVKQEEESEGGAQMVNKKKKKKRTGKKAEVKSMKRSKTQGDMSRSSDLSLRAATRGWVGNRDSAGTVDN